MKKAFSLVELSIVLVIIGLLISGVTAGNKLLESSKLNTLVSEITSLKTTYHTFKLTYTMPPGDLNIAQSYFGTTGIVNGDGNGEIDFSTEVYNVPEQLEKAELLRYSYNSGANYLVLDSFKTFVWMFHTKGYGGYDYPSSNILQIGESGNINNAFLTPRQAHKVDKKLDDGISTSGKFSYRRSGNVTDATCSGGGTTYDLTSSDLGCNIVYELEEV